MSYLFNEFLYRPLLNLLFFLYDFVWSDLGVAIILLTILVRLLLLPLFYKSAQSQSVLQKISPQIREIQKKYKDDKEKQVQEMLAVYKQHKVNPFSGFLLMIIQLPILIALYKVFWGGFSAEILKNLYSFIEIPQDISYSFLGVVNLNQRNLILVILAALFQYFQSKLLLDLSKNKKEKRVLQNQEKSGSSQELAEKFSRQMIFFGPFLTLIILYPLPSAISLYWLTTSVFSVIQQVIINRKLRGKEDEQRSSGNSSAVN